MAMQVKFPFGKLVSVLVTHVDDTSGDVFLQISDEAGKLDALMAEIEQNVLSGRAKPPKASEIIVGCIYLVQYQEDSRWYRARVLGVNVSEDQCEVFFVDYGNTEHVPLSCVRNAEDRFCELPPQSFECELENFDRFRGDRFEEMLTLLNDTILEQELYCKAVQLKKNCILVTQLFFDDKGVRSVLGEIQSGGPGATTEVLSDGHDTIPRKPNLKREMKYELINLPPDSFHDLSVTWVEDPSHFWCQLLSNVEVLEELMEKLADVYTNLEPAMLPLQSCTVGYPCCAKFYEDDAWYRAIITNVSSIATGQIEVRFVDYGNTQNTELSDVKDLKDEFLKEPCQAMYFAIAGVDPASKDGLWADEAKELFDKLIKSKHVVGLVTSMENDGRHRVKLMDTTSDLDMELNQILIAANYGVKSPDPRPPTSLTTATHVSAFKPSEPAPRAAPPPVFAKENVQVGIEEKVLVTNIITPGKFYCQLFKNGPKLENLMMEVGRHYSKLGANEELLSSPSPGDPCCAQFSEDGCWYRAVVLSTTPKGVAVLYIDYGNSETVPPSKIKKLNPKFSELPQQGIECTLNRIKPKFTGGVGEPKWRSGDTKKFEDLALEKEGKITVVSQDGHGVCRVELVVRNRREDQNMSEQLLIGGNAELADGALSASANLDNLKSQTFPKPDLEVGHFEDVVISYTEHPCNFWCQLQKTVTDLDSLMQEISQLYSSEGQRGSISSPACGMLCCAQFTEDNKWYRGKITGVKKGGLVEVHFVDYGNYEMLPLSRIKKLQAEYLLLPPQAVKCALAKIDPLNKDLLSDDVMNRFEELTFDKELVMMADKFDESSGTFEVVLLDTTEGKNLDVAKELQTIMGPSTNREVAHIVGIEIQPGTTERVFVSSVTSHTKFSCQLMKTADSLDELMNQMFEHYEQLSNQQEQMLKPSVGEFCAAKFTLDDGWYRAKVLEVQGENVSVLYIDYGNSETLSLSRLKVLNSKFHSLPSQAIDCSLSGNFTGITDTQFQELVSEKEFTAKVTSVKSGVAVLDLVSKETNQSIANILSIEVISTTPSACTVAYSQWEIGDAFDVFVPFVESAQKFFCQASNQINKLDVLMIKLEDYYSNNSENLSTIQVGSCCAAWYSDGGWYRAKVEHVEGREVKVNYIDYGDNATIPLSSIRTLKPEFCVLPAQAVPCCLKGLSASQGPKNFEELVLYKEFKLQVISAKNGGIYEVDLVPQDGSTAISQILSKDVETQSTSFLSVPNIQWKLGDKVEVFIPFVESAQKFFCQTSQSDLDDLMTRIEEHYCANQDNMMSVSAGTFCVARYEDGGWYRAQVTQVQGQSISVFYIDYGDTATVPLNSLRSLSPEFASLPAQAVKCCLKGYSTSKGPENFKDHVIEQEFEAQVVSVKGQDIYEVELVSKDGSTSISREFSKGAEATGPPTSCLVASVQWKPGDKVEVFVPFVESAQKFFCQAAQSSSDLDNLMIRLEGHYGPDQETVTSISAEEFCVAQYVDGGWYRAQVTQVQGQSVSVFYIDYGDAATLPMSSIRTLRPEFSSLPAQAVQCSLKGASSSGGPQNFKDIVLEQEFDLHVIASKQPGIYEVELVSKDGSQLFGDALPSEAKIGTSLLAEMTEGSFIQLCPTACISPHLFHCQIATADHKGKLEQLMDQLQEYYEALGEQEQCITNITVGMNCAAVFADDGLWYRGKIVKVLGQQMVEVCYLDFGNCETVPLSKVKTINTDLLQLPAQAIQCSIFSISPVSGTEWPDVTVERFNNLTMHKMLFGRIIRKGNDNVEIELVDTSDASVDINIGELLVKEGLASLGTPASAKPSSALRSLSDLKKTELSGNEKVYVTAVESPGCFFCQISGSEEKLASLMSEIASVYDSMSANGLNVNSISVGDVCCAQFSEDNQWYRAVVEENTANALTVRFIDYGNVETLPIDRTKVLKDVFFGEPPLAIKCGLHNVQPSASPTWPDEAGIFFEELTSEKELDAKFLSFTEPFLIQLSDNGADIGDELVKAQLAVAKPTSQDTSASEEYSKPVIVCGEIYDVCITHMSSPGKFYCQLVNMSEQLDGMMNDLNSHYFQLSETEGCLDSPSASQPCVALFEEMWYRAKIINFSGNDVTVHYVDYGNEVTLKYSDVKKMTPLFLKTAEVAIECSLDLNRDQWSEEATALFEELTGESQLVIKIMGQQGDTYQVKVFNTNEQCISDKVYNTFSGAVQESQKEKTTLKEMAVRSGLTENIYVTHVNSTREFYIQLSKTYDHLLQMMSEISRVYSNLADDIRPEHLLVGTPICALYAEDGEWYRAVLESIPSEFEVGVRFVDYGNSDVVLLSDVRQLHEKFWNLPIQAVCCCLDSQVDRQSFQQRVDNKELKATFLSLEDSMQWKVSLSDEVGKIGAELDSRIVEITTDEFQIKEYLQPEINPEMRSQVYVSHVESPDEFYVQFESSLDELSILSGKMSEFYPRLRPSTFVLNNPCAGMSCCARFSEDGNWYRGKIERVGSAGALVQFVDYGNCEDVPFSDIKDPEKTFMQIAQQAILCGLDATKDAWSAEEVSTFRTVALDKCFEARFIIRDGPKWRVCLENNKVSVADMFMTKDAVFYQKTGSEVSSVQTMTYTQQKLSSGQVEEVFVSHVTESGEFFVQLSKTSADLETIEFLVSETYDHLGPTEEAMEISFVDSLCCAKFSEDFKWYRALVTKVLSEVEVEVLFVDYGNSDTLKVETVKQIKSELLSFSVQAVKCRLEGSKEVWTENDVQQFEARVMDKPLHVTFTRQEGDTWFVTIQELDMFTSKTTPPKVKNFSKEVFDCKNRENAYFVYADSPDCLWLQPERAGNALIALMDQIANDVTGQAMDKSQLLPRVPCLGQFTENDVWHRAQILDVQDSNNLTVFYVDYGNSETLAVDRLHPISDTHLKLPAQAIRCHLADMQGVDPSKVTDYLNEVLFEKVCEVEVQDQRPDGSCTVKLYEPGVEQSINEQVFGECLGDTSLIEETILEQTTPPRLPAAREKRAFKFPELKIGAMVLVSFVSAFLPDEMQLLLTERIEERDQIINSVTAMYEALEANELKLENPEVGVLCCVHFCPDENETKKWYRGEVISISADETATVKLVDYGTHEKIQISDLKCLKDELLEMPVFFLESSLANICPSSEDGQWSPECSNILESLCHSKALTAEITHVFGDSVELILTDDSGKSINQSLIDLGYAKACDNQEDFSGEEQSLKWPELQVGQCVEVFMMGVKDLQSIQLQLADSEEDLTVMRERLTAVYSNLGEAEEIVGNPRVGQVCCAQFADDGEWYRAAITCVSDAGVEVKFIDYGNMDVVLSVKQLREEFFILPVQCFECCLGGVKPAPDFSETEVAAKLIELCDGKQLTGEVTRVSGDSVVVNLFVKTGSGKESIADTLVKLGHALFRPTSPNEPRRLSVSEEGKIVYNYPEYGDVHNVRLISVNSPSDFWCQITNSETELKTLSEKIELFYQSLGENDLRLLCLQDKDVCCAKFTEDDKWYRSLVNNVCSDGQVCVCAVDYSKQETLSLNRIKKLEAEFALLPVQSINCSLGNIEPPHKYYGQEWSSEAVERFKELCEGKDLKIKVRGRDGDFTLVELLDSMSLSVADRLLSEQLAVESKSPLTVSPLKSTVKQVTSSVDQVEKALEQSSEEDVFQEAESGIEDVENLAGGKEDVEEEEEEFHDSTDQITAEEKKDTLASCENEQEEAMRTTESSQEVPDVERKEIQDDKKVEEGGKKGLEQVVGEVMEEKPCPETEEQQEDGVSKDEGAAEELESDVVDKEEKQAETDAPSSEREEVSEHVEGQFHEHVESTETAEELEKAEEEGEQELKMEEDKAEKETDGVERLETAREEKAEINVEESPVAAADSEETNNVDSPETTGEEQGELTGDDCSAAAVISEEMSDTAVKETDSADRLETAKEGQEEPMMEESPAADVTEQKDEGAEQPSEELAEAQEGVTDAFSEEDLTAITGSAEEGVESIEENKSDEERLQQFSLEETNKQTSAEEESAKDFLEEILTEVCRDDDQPQTEHREQLDKGEDAANNTIATEEKPAAITSSEAVRCDDVDDSVLSDEALDQLDRELENVEEKQPNVMCTDTMTNGTREQKTHEVVENGQDGVEQCDITSCHFSKLSTANGTTEVGNDLAEGEIELTVE